jgi:hypothetical protein
MGVVHDMQLSAQGFRLAIECLEQAGRKQLHPAQLPFRFAGGHNGKRDHDRGAVDERQALFAFPRKGGEAHLLESLGCREALSLHACVPDCPGSLRHPPLSCCRPVVVVQPAEHRDLSDRTGEPGGGRFTGYRRPLGDPLVRPSRVEVAQGVFSEDVPQMRF